MVTRGASGLEAQVTDTEMDTGNTPLPKYFTEVTSGSTLPSPFAYCPSAVPCIVLSLGYKGIRIPIFLTFICKLSCIQSQH